MTNKLEIPRLLAWRLAGLDPDYTTAQLDADEEELRALLAAPVAHRHEWDINNGSTATVCSVCGIRSSDDLAAPVVERQPVAEVTDMKYNRVQFYRATGDTTKPYLLPGTKLYIAPPELAELQAAIAQQAAESELLKGGLPGLTFRYQHPLTKEIRSASLTKTEVADGMEDTLYEKLVAQFCQCESVGETNVVDCNCDEYIHDFDLVADDTKAEQPAPVAVVLPERKDESKVLLAAWNKGWNACLDKVKELNQ